MGSSLLVGASGMQASQQMLDVVGNNLANVNTTGFKSQQLSFRDLFSQTLRPAALTPQGGGIDPQRVGRGVTTEVGSDQAQGTIVSSSSPLDLAIQGGGAFVVSNGSQTFYPRDGSFS